MAKAMDVADDIITLAAEQNKPVYNLVLQKIMYFLNVSAYIEQGKPLIEDEQFEKWDYGPVISDIYYEYSDNGPGPITKPVVHQSVSFGKDGVPKVNSYNFNQATFDKKYGYESTYISRNLNRLLKYDPQVLIDKSHLEPQWSVKEKPFYDMQQTYNFYRMKKNIFW